MTDGTPPEGRRARFTRLLASPLGRRLAGGAAWSTAGTLATRLLQLVTGVVLARQIGKEGFGKYGLVLATVGMFQTLASGGLGLTATKFLAEVRHRDPVRASRILALSGATSVVGGAVVATLAFAFADMLAARTMSDASLAPVLRIAVPALFFGAWNSSQAGALAGLEAFRTLAAASAVSGALAFASITGGVVGWGLEGAVGGAVVAAAAGCAVHHVALTRERKRAGVGWTLDGAVGEWRLLAGFSLPALLSTLLVGPAQWATSAIIASTPHGYDELGLFNAANQWRTAVLFIPGTVAAAMLPVLSSLKADQGDGRYGRVLRLNLLATFAASIGVAGPLALLAPFIMRAYGASFDSGAFVLVVLLASAVLGAVIAVAGQSLAASGRMWWGFGLNAIWATALIGSTWIFRDRGALGLAIANLIAYGVHLLTVGTFVVGDLTRVRRSEQAVK